MRAGTEAVQAIVSIAKHGINDVHSRWAGARKSVESPFKRTRFYNTGQGDNCAKHFNFAETLTNATLANSALLAVET